MTVTVQSPTTASLINHCLEGNIANKYTWNVREEKLPITVGIYAASGAQVSGLDKAFHSVTGERRLSICKVSLWNWKYR